MYHMLRNCRLEFRFLSESLVFTQNPGLYMLIYPCSLPNGLLFNLILSYGIVTLSVVMSVCQGGGLKIEVGMDSNTWVQEGMRDAILAQKFYCAKPNTDPDNHFSSLFHKGFGFQDPNITQDNNVVTMIAIRMLNRLVTWKMSSVTISTQESDFFTKI